VKRHSKVGKEKALKAKLSGDGSTNSDEARRRRENERTETRSVEVTMVQDPLFVSVAFSTVHSICTDCLIMCL
jgi:hypothetical protein